MEETSTDAQAHIGDALVIEEAPMDEAALAWALAIVERNVAHYYRGARSVGWSARRKRAELADPAVRLLVASAGGERVGFAAYIPRTDEPARGEYARARPRRTEPVLYVLELHVLPGRTGRGVGSALVSALEARARADGIVVRVALTCFVANARAWRLYTARLGFAVDYCCDDYGILSKAVCAAGRP